MYAHYERPTSELLNQAFRAFGVNVMKPKIFFFYLARPIDNTWEFLTNIVTATSSAEAEQRVKELSNSYTEWLDFVDVWLETDEAHVIASANDMPTDMVCVNQLRTNVNMSCQEYLNWVQSVTSRKCCLTGNKEPDLVRAIDWS